MRGSVAQKVFKMAYQMLFQKVHILTFFFLFDIKQYPLSNYFKS